MSIAIEMVLQEGGQGFVWRLWVGMRLVLVRVQVNKRTGNGFAIFFWSIICFLLIGVLLTWRWEHGRV